MIPKIIHLCWFSNDEYPQNIKMCIESWKKLLPDYQIKLWDSEMAMATKIPFICEAINMKKWAFATDALRVYALYNEGGVYIDSDVCLRRRFDELLQNDVVLFQEYHPLFIKKGFTDKEGNRLANVEEVPGIGIQAAFMISSKGNPAIKAILDYYIDRHFILSNNQLDMKRIAPSIFAESLEPFGYKYIDNEQILSENVTILPSSYVAGSYIEVSKQSFALHCISHSWGSTSYKIKKKIVIFASYLKRLFGNKEVKTEYELIRNFINGIS